MNDLETVKATVKRMQSVVLNMLCDIDKFCADNGIQWFLSGGSVLGAVRHQGFIPWDDDGDIMMPRPDYERFLMLFKEKFKDKYGVGSFETDKKWHRQNAKIWDLSTKARCDNLDDEVLGVFIDVFPIDGLPENAVVRSIYYKRLKVLSGLQNASVRTKFLDGEKNIAVKRLASVITRPFGARFFTARITALAKRYNYESSKYVGASTACHYGDKETMNKEDMDKEVRLNFEGHRLPVPIGYEKYLSSLYGDYMTIPEGAEEKGYSHLDHWSVEFLNTDNV